ncbi:MAG: hypothetical protein AMS22_15330 [Thiotrichales bacterium SG8_50]|nr:MAG: hypothetical protein AMS22_15330 [Thiotrichales bacterium SG8_50]
MMLDGSPWNGQTIECQFRAADSTATFIGDLVELDGTAGTAYRPTVKQGAAATTKFFGVVVGFEYDPADLTSIYRVASTQRKCKVVPAIDVIFEIQEDSDGGALTLDACGETCDIIVGSGSTTTGLSAMELDSSNLGTGLNLLLLQPVDRPDNAIGNHCKWLVRVNEQVFAGGDIGV